MDEIVVDGPAGPIGAIDWGGDGDPLLLVHGFGTNAAEWAPVVPHLDDYRCVAFDLPGHGRTAAPQDLRWELWLETTDAVLDHFALQRDRLAIVGGSFGGGLAVWYAGHRPGLRAVVGVDSARNASGRPPPAPKTAEQWRADGCGATGDEAWYEAEVAEMVADHDYPDLCARRSHVRLPDGRYQAVPTDEFLVAMEGLGSRGVNPLIDPDMFGRLTCPTLLLCANDGAAVDIREYVDAMPARFPMVSVVWMDGPHALDWHAPEVVAQHIERFVAAAARS